MSSPTNSALSSPSPFPSSPSLSLSSPPSSRPPSPTTNPHHILIPLPAHTDPFTALRALAPTLHPGAGDLVLLVFAPSATNAMPGWLTHAIREATRILGTPFAVHAHVDLTGNIVLAYYADDDGDVLDTIECNVISAGAADEQDTRDTPALAPLFSALSFRALLPPSTLPSGALFHILERPAFVFSPLFSPSSQLESPASPFTTPSPAAWHTLWRAWDLVTLHMVPPALLHAKPIDLRHKCLFYIGHIPTFLDMLLSNALNEPPTEPAVFRQIFERGIDPHVDDPEHCHRHSVIPTNDADWPSLLAILAFRDAVRARVLRLYSSASAALPTTTTLDTDTPSYTTPTLPRHLARALVFAYEHEAFHIETILYMLLQAAPPPAPHLPPGAAARLPPGFAPPIVHAWATARGVNTGSSDSDDESKCKERGKTVLLGPAMVVMGHDDPESADLHGEAGAGAETVRAHAFGWDNESPARAVRVRRFRAEWQPVTNGEFFEFWSARRSEVEMPLNWVVDEEEVKVRTFHGALPLSLAHAWPVLAPYSTLSAYARACGGRLPTEPELRLFLDTFDVGHAGGANVGFRHWHPVPATTGGVADNGRGHNGGVWEWTSDVFDMHYGLEPTTLFPGYSTDFFDGKHQVVLGASYATIPRLAGRRTLRNFYQPNYSYAWVGGRVVYDVEE